MDTRLLSEHEEQLIKRYHRQRPLARTGAISVFILCLLWLVLVVVDNYLAQSRTPYIFGLIVFVAFYVAYLVLYCYGTFADISWREQGEWQELVERARGLRSQSGRDGGVDGRPEGVAKAFGVQLAPTWPRVAAIVLVPLLVLSLVYVPEIQHSREALLVEQKAAGTTIDVLRASLAKECAEVHADNPYEEAQGWGYSMAAYLRALGLEGPNSSVYVRIGSDGAVEEVSYSMDVDVTQTKEENIERIESDLELLHHRLAAAEVTWRSSDLYTIDRLSHTFLEQFTVGSYYVGIHHSETGPYGAHVIFDYDTFSEDEFSEYTKPVIVLTILA